MKMAEEAADGADAMSANQIASLDQIFTNSYETNEVKQHEQLKVLIH